MSEVTFEPFQRVLVRDSEDEEWFATSFSHMRNGKGPFIYGTSKGSFKHCIPYNEETAHLLGTTDSPTHPELEFRAGDHVEVSECRDYWSRAIYVKKMSNGRHCVLLCGASITDVWSNCRHADW